MGWPGDEPTQRQCLAWGAWLDLEDDRSTLLCQYVMRLTHAVEQIPSHVWGKQGRRYKPEEYLLTLDPSKVKPMKLPPGIRPVTKEDIAAFHRNSALLAAGGPGAVAGKGGAPGSKTAPRNDGKPPMRPPRKRK
jgi:hypothetical protein